MDIDRNVIIILFDIFGKFYIHKYNNKNKSIRYQAKIELTVPIIVRNDIIEELTFWKINAFISRNTIIISGNKNIETFIREYGRSLKYQYNKIETIRKFINHRLERNKQRFDIIDEFYFSHLIILNKKQYGKK